MTHWWLIFKIQSAITEKECARPQTFAWQTDLVPNAVLVSDHSDVAGPLIWAPWRLHYNCIFLDKNFRQVTKFYPDGDLTSPLLCYPRAQGEYRVIWDLRGLWETLGTWKAPCIFCKSLSKWEMTSFKQLNLKSLHPLIRSSQPRPTFFFFHRDGWKGTRPQEQQSTCWHGSVSHRLFRKCFSKCSSDSWWFGRDNGIDSLTPAGFHSFDTGNVSEASQG